METPALAFPISGSIKSASVPEAITRRSADFPPSIWGDYFLKYSAPHLTDIDDDMKKEHQRLRDEVREMIVEAGEDLPHKLNLIDAVQRLGVSYHFETEIEAALHHICDNFSRFVNDDEAYSDDLHTVSLLFRLLRQQGHPISCNVFNRFKNNDGELRESLISDVGGMLSLYEASHVRVRGEGILDEALSFTTTHLQFLAPTLTNPLAAQVSHALKQPIHTGLTRLEAKHFMSFYEEDNSHNKVLLYFAKLDLNLLQKLHQSELSEITRWWVNLDIVRKLSFARDRMVECYFWILGVYYEPHYFLARRIMTKVITLTSIIDDIYDVYGTLEELVLFTDAIERWDSNAKDQLPGYMRFCYEALLDVYSMINEEMAKQGKSYRVDYAKAAMKDQVKAYFKEAKWSHEGYIPTMNECMCVAQMTAGYSMLATTSLVGMGELVTKESFDWVSSNPLIVQAASVICRLMDDMVDHQLNEKTGHVASAVECYMKEHGASEEDALVEFKKQVTNAWKDMNAECLRPTAVPMPLLVRVLNLARVINVLFKDDDYYTNSGTMAKAFVTSMLVDPVPINTKH